MFQCQSFSAFLLSCDEVHCFAGIGGNLVGPATANTNVFFLQNSTEFLSNCKYGNAVNILTK